MISIIKKCNSISLISGLVGVLTSIFFTSIVFGKLAVSTFIGSVFFGIVIVLLAEAIINYFYRRVMLEGHELKYTIARIVIFMVLWLLTIKLF
ncbi:hypothetical protein [Helicovermis profundi]|uniref:Uncharacterized protein n=1 Tax=Helicovermis profundi TaxID=3065157 RepID=A0AAU9EAN3_9FIRM|nr:hypothetical protein HLPR_06850 [Clostridia bacterium S502]